MERQCERILVYKCQNISVRLQVGRGTHYAIFVINITNGQNTPYRKFQFKNGKTLIQKIVGSFGKKLYNGNGKS